MSEFRRIGPEVLCGEIFVDLADVQPVHDVVADDLMLAARAVKLVWTPGADELQYAHYFTSLDEREVDAPNQFVSARLRHESDPDTWRLSVHHRTFVSSDRHSNKRTSYRFEAAGDHLIQAKKEVFFVQGSSRIVFDAENNPIEMVTTDRKMYERPLRPKDCEGLLAFLLRSAKRAQVSRK